MDTMTEKKKKTDAYAQAVSSGRYDRRDGLHGKYDNVRLYWEDAITRLFMRPHVDRVVDRVVGNLGRVRILDLGCGSGDGYEMFMSLVKKDPGIYEHEVRVILPDYLGQYTGIDKNEALLGQTRERWKDNPKMDFRQGDFSVGLPVSKDEPPYDIYFTSFGSLSHLTEDQTVRLFSDIVRHANDGALIVGDWLGRYSYEWQELWDADTDTEQWMDYYISYIYPPDQMKKTRKKLDKLTLRLLCREEVERITDRVKKKTGARLVQKDIFDRSLFVGRHIDTGDYNKYLKPYRRAVNKLHENNLRTYLEPLLLDYRPKPGFEFVNMFFDQLQASWNALIRYTMEICERYDDDKGRVVDPPDVPAYYPEPLKRAMLDMLRVVEGSGWLRIGDARANVIEPQLGYALRGLEMSLQQGMGNGHGLVGIFEVSKGKRSGK